MAIVPTSQVGVGVYSNAGADVVVDVSPDGSSAARAGAAAATDQRPPAGLHHRSTDPSGLNQLLRRRPGAGRRRLPARLRAARRPGALVLPGRLLPRPQRRVDVRPQRRARAERHVLHVAADRELRQPRRVPVPRPDASASQALVLAVVRRAWAPTAGSTCSSPRCARTARRICRSPSRSRHGSCAIDLTTMQVVDRRPAANSSAALYGFSVESDDDYTYLYAHCHRQFGWDAVPVRQPAGVRARLGLRRPHDRGSRAERPVRPAAGVLERIDVGHRRLRQAVNVVPAGRLVSASQMYFARREVGLDHQGRRLVRRPGSRSTSPPGRRARTRRCARSPRRPSADAATPTSPRCCRSGAATGRC